MLCARDFSSLSTQLWSAKTKPHGNWSLDDGGCSYQCRTILGLSSVAMMDVIR